MLLITEKIYRICNTRHEGSFRQTPSGDRLLRAVPHPNVPGAHPQHPRERLRRIDPVPHERP